jgi:hypothetical protein
MSPLARSKTMQLIIGSKFVIRIEVEVVGTASEVDLAQLLDRIREASCEDSKEVKLMTSGEAAALIGISRAYLVRKWEPKVKYGRDRRYSQDEVRDILIQIGHSPQVCDEMIMAGTFHKTNTADELLFTTGDVAKILQVSRPYVIKAYAPSSFVGKHRRYSQEAVIDLLMSHRNLDRQEAEQRISSSL